MLFLSFVPVNPPSVTGDDHDLDGGASMKSLVLFHAIRGTSPCYTVFMAVFIPAAAISFPSPLNP
jgi:hypothetical protein